MVENQVDSFRWGQPAVDYIVPEIGDAVDSLGERIGDVLAADLGLGWDIVPDWGLRKAMHPDVFGLAQENAERIDQRLALLAARIQWLDKEGYPPPKALLDELQFWAERQDSPEKVSSAEAFYERLKTATDEDLGHIKVEFPEIGNLDIWDKWSIQRRLTKHELVCQNRGNDYLPRRSIAPVSYEPEILMEMARLQLVPGVTSFDFNLKDLVSNGLIPYKEYKKFEKLSRLNGFRMRVFVSDDFLEESGGKLSAAIKNAGALIYGEMGWDSCLETMEQIPAILSRLTHNGVVITYDMPGQMGTTFKDPNELIQDRFLFSHQGVTMAVDLVLRRLFGLDGADFREVALRDDAARGRKKGQTYQNKIEVTLAHSRRAAGNLYKGYGKWFDDDKVGFVLLNPVFKTGGVLPLKDWQMNILGEGSSVFGPLLQTDMGTRLGVGFLINYLATGGTSQVKELHKLTFQQTPVTVIAETIRHLAKEHLPQFPAEAEKYGRVRVYHAFDDHFVPNERTLKRLLKFINGKFIIPLGRDGEDHYFFSYLPGHLPEHEKNRFDVCIGVLEVLKECGWLRPERPGGKENEEMMFLSNLLRHNLPRLISFMKDQLAFFYRYRYRG
jgi:hypothetical protein